MTTAGSFSVVAAPSVMLLISSREQQIIFTAFGSCRQIDEVILARSGV